MTSSILAVVTLARSERIYILVGSTGTCHADFVFVFRECNMWTIRAHLLQLGTAQQVLLLSFSISGSVTTRNDVKRDNAFSFCLLRVLAVLSSISSSSVLFASTIYWKLWLTRVTKNVLGEAKELETRQRDGAHDSSSTPTAAPCYALLFFISAHIAINHNNKQTTTSSCRRTVNKAYCGNEEMCSSIAGVLDGLSYIPSKGS